MSKLKEIWHVWKGVGEPPAGVTCVILRSGLIIPSDIFVFDWNHGYEWSDRLDDIVAYTLSKTRERVECDKCGGYGLVHGGEIFMLVDGESIPNFITEHDCPDCKGHGYIWRTTP